MSRRTYRWDPETKALVELSSDWTPEPRTELMTGTCYEGLQATDGTDISSRAKHREYMRLNGFTTADDYTKHWEKKAAERAELFTTGGDHRARKEALGRAIYEVEKRGRKR